MHTKITKLIEAFHQGYTFTKHSDTPGRINVRGSTLKGNVPRGDINLPGDPYEAAEFCKAYMRIVQLYERTEETEDKL